MTIVKPREVFEQPSAHWSFITQPLDRDFEDQHFDRKEAGRPVGGVVSNSALKELREQVIETLSAFSNSNREGGLLILGIDSDGNVAGIDHLTETQRNNLTDFNTQLNHHCAEAKYFTCTSEHGCSRRICLIFTGFAISAICETPGNNPRAWIRNGQQCVAVTQEIRDNLRAQKGLLGFDNDPYCEYSRDDIDNDVLSEFRKSSEWGFLSKFDDERLLKEAGAIVKKDGKSWLTRPGVLFFTSNPQRVFAHAYVRLMRFGVGCADFANRGSPTLNKEFRGPITAQIRAARTFFRESGFFKRFQTRLFDGGFKEEHEIPPLAVDEAIVNAVVHRDYSTMLPVECEAYLDAFIVKNPGRVIQRNLDLPSAFSLDTTNLDSTPRNTKLLEWLKIQRDPDGKAFVQAVSEGTKRIASEMRTLELPPPRFKLGNNESILTLESNAPAREAAMLSLDKTGATEMLNFFPLFAVEGRNPVSAAAVRPRQRDFLAALASSLTSKNWFIDRISFSRIQTHLRGNDIAIPEQVRRFVRLFPAYSVQIQESFSKLYVSIDYACEVACVRRLNLVLGVLSSEMLLGFICIADTGEWRKGKIVQIDGDWTTVHFFDSSSEEVVPTAKVIPNLPKHQLERLLDAERVEFDLASAIKKASFASQAGAARTRLERIANFASVLATDIFPISVGDLKYTVGADPIALGSQRVPGTNSMLLARLVEPEVEFRGHKSTADVRDGITKFGSFDTGRHEIEIVPVCSAAYKNKMEQLLERLAQGKYKYRGSERTFSTRFVYQAVVAGEDASDLKEEIARLLARNAAWVGTKILNRIFLVQCPDNTFALDDERAPYYQCKRLLLEAGMPCQMIDSSTLNNPDWKDLNLALNIAAKCGITPWVLPESIPDADFFVGLSYTQARDGRRIMGFANVFNSYGHWIFYAGNTTMFDPAKRPGYLAELAKTTLEKLKATNSVPVSSNIVFHHSVRIAREDRDAIVSSVRSVLADVSVTFVWVNSHHNARLFDSRPETDGSSVRGTYVPLSKNRILLSTTGSNPFRKALGTPKPLELTVTHFRPRSSTPSDYDLRSLALQALSLTKLNWASTDSFCGEPITIKYAGDIAYLTAAFLRQRDDFNLHSNLERTPWFI